MNIDLGGNTLVNGYFAGIVVGAGPTPGTDSNWIIKSAAYTAVVASRKTGTGKINDSK